MDMELMDGIFLLLISIVIVFHFTATGILIWFIGFPLVGLMSIFAIYQFLKLVLII
jgi:hypothetical protein